MLRRNFLRIMIAVPCGGALLFPMEGCSLSSLEAQVNGYIPVIIQTVDAMLGLFDPALAPLFNAGASIIKAAVADVEAAYADWQNALAAEKPGLAGKIAAALQVVAQDFGNFIDDVDAKAPASLAIDVTAVASIALGAIQYFINALSGTPGTARTVKPRTAQVFLVQPLHYSVKQYKAAVNAKLASFGRSDLEIR